MAASGATLGEDGALTASAWQPGSGWVPQKESAFSEQQVCCRVKDGSSQVLEHAACRCRVSAKDTLVGRSRALGRALFTLHGQVGQSLLPYWSLRTEGTEGPGSLLASPVQGNILPDTGNQETHLPTHLWAKVFKRGDSSLHRAQKPPGHLLSLLLLCRMPFGKQLLKFFFHVLFTMCSGNFCWIRLKMRPVSWQREGGRGVLRALAGDHAVSPSPKAQLRFSQPGEGGR